MSNDFEIKTIIVLLRLFLFAIGTCRLEIGTVRIQMQYEYYDAQL
jgi:hypothetical protein